MIKCLTGGVCKNFDRLHSDFREMYVSGDRIIRLTNHEADRFRNIQRMVRETEDGRPTRIAAREALVLLEKNPRNEYIIFECLERLSRIKPASGPDPVLDWTAQGHAER
jgi:hypothetical protein